MDIKSFEENIIKEFAKVILKIIKNYPKLNISAKARAGAEISDFLEEKFVEYSSKNKLFKDSEASPKGATKNPWDAKTNFCFKNHEEIIWIDFKVLKTSGKDSNPDIGSPNKIIKFIKEGNFYLLYVYVFYKEIEKGLKFVKVNGSYTKLYFLKDINRTFRRNPKNQLQVNMSAPPEYRTRKNFIKLLSQKLKESHERQIKISKKVLQKLSAEEKALLKVNKKSEARILKNLR
ncbi:MAG: hypothetical protein ACKKMW_01515 [Candidatus Nealsonbacteria bacterium]